MKSRKISLQCVTDYGEVSDHDSSLHEPAIFIQGSGHKSLSSTIVVEMCSWSGMTFPYFSYGRSHNSRSCAFFLLSTKTSCAARGSFKNRKNSPNFQLLIPYRVQPRITCYTDFNVHLILIQNANLPFNRGISKHRNDEFWKMLNFSTTFIQLETLIIAEHPEKFLTVRFSHIRKRFGQPSNIWISNNVIGDHQNGVFEHVFHRRNPDNRRGKTRRIVENGWVYVDVLCPSGKRA